MFARDNASKASARAAVPCSRQAFGDGLVFRRVSRFHTLCDGFVMVVSPFHDGPRQTISKPPTLRPGLLDRLPAGFLALSLALRGLNRQGLARGMERHGKIAHERHDARHRLVRPCPPPGPPGRRCRAPFLPASQSHRVVSRELPTISLAEPPRPGTRQGQDRLSDVSCQASGRSGSVCVARARLPGQHPEGHAVASGGVAGLAGQGSVRLPK